MSALAFFPWWLGALALGATTIAFTALLHRPFGVTGSYARVLRYREERKAERDEERFADEAALEAALAAATMEQFGEPSSAPETPLEEASSSPSPAFPNTRLPVAGEALFLLLIPVGAMIAAAIRGKLTVRFDLGETFTRVIGGGARAVLVLFAGGLLVGFGTRLAGGCTSGHGLSGCARLQRASLVATACFLGTAILVSFLLERMS